MYKEIDDQIHPDLVLVHFWQDDAQQYVSDGVHVYDTGRSLSDEGSPLTSMLPLPTGVGDFLIAHSRLYDDALILTRAPMVRPRDQRPDWQLACNALADINARVQRAGGRLLVLASPTLDGPSPQPNGMLPFVRECAATHGFEVVDLSEWLPDVTTEQVALDGCHFNEAGHRVLGQRLAEYLLQHDLKD